MIFHFDGLSEAFVLALATTSISVTIARAEIFAPLREYISEKSVWAGKLVSCSYCVSHWVSMVFVATYRPIIIEMWIFSDLIVSVFAIVTISAILSKLIIGPKESERQKPKINSVTGE
jgi:hypothetical protein